MAKPIPIVAKDFATDTLDLQLADRAVHPVAHAKQHPVRQAQNDDHVSHLAQATLLNWLGQSPITFHRIYVDITGSVVSGLWLSYALNKAARASPGEFEGDDFVFSMSARDCEVETGITRGQQVTCRKSLSELGLMSEEGGQRKAPIYRLHMGVVANRMMRESQSLAALMASHASRHSSARG